MRIVRMAALVTMTVLLGTPALPQGKPAPDNAYLCFIWPQHGTVIKGGFWCRFGLRNMGVTHAGDDFANSGHHHLLIDINEALAPGAQHVIAINSTPTPASNSTSTSSMSMARWCSGRPA
jgi:Domain of unknown function (DUF4399)